MTGSPLRAKLEEVASETGCSLKDLTVLANQNDPFRVDTPLGHEEGEWLVTVKRDLVGSRPIHLRGLHYALLGQTKPNGKPYTNTEKDWVWLQNGPSKSARWLDYLPFGEIVDQRNTPPEITAFEHPDPKAVVLTGIDINIPTAAQLKPEMGLRDFRGVQPYKLVYVGEKSSLYDHLQHVAWLYEADIYMPMGEMSDTMIHTLASTSAEDGRPTVVLYFSDCDPSGWQMPVSLSRKLQAVQVKEFPDLALQVRRAALTPDQVREYGLPSTPMKETERRADKWREAMRIEQTEIDALAALHPAKFEELARAASAPWFDKSLENRVEDAKWEWIHAAQDVLESQLGADMLEDFRAQAAEKLKEMREEIEALKDSLDVEVSLDDLPPIVVPEAELPDPVAEPALFDTRWSFADQCRSLIDAKRYEAT